MNSSEKTEEYLKNGYVKEVVQKINQKTEELKKSQVKLESKPLYQKRITKSQSEISIALNNNEEKNQMKKENDEELEDQKKLQKYISMRKIERTRSPHVVFEKRNSEGIVTARLPYTFYSF